MILISPPDTLSNITLDNNLQDKSNRLCFNSEKLNLDREKLLTQKQIADKQLEIARENKNKYDVGAKKKK